MESYRRRESPVGLAGLELMVGTAELGFTVGLAGLELMVGSAELGTTVGLAGLGLMVGSAELGFTVGSAELGTAGLVLGVGAKEYLYGDGLMVAGMNLRI